MLAAIGAELSKLFRQLAARFAHPRGIPVEADAGILMGGMADLACGGAQLSSDLQLEDTLYDRRHTQG